MRIVFAGTPEFAAASLRALLDAGHVPVAVLTQPDRPAGRGRKLTASPVKQLALEANIDILQPTTLRDESVQQQLRDLRADLFVVAAYGLLLPQEVLDIPSVACVNVHASLLPRWRGAAPIQAAILAGDEETGISLMQMDIGLDTGPVWATWATEIAADEIAGVLQDRLAEAGGTLLVDNIEAIVAGELPASAQDDDGATYAHKLKTADAQLDWQEPAEQLHRMLRAYNPVPGAWTLAGEERIKCWKGDIVDASSPEPGTVISCDANGVVVACSDGAIALSRLQRPGKKPVSAAEFAAQIDLTGKRLG